MQHKETFIMQIAKQRVNAYQILKNTLLSTINLDNPTSAFSKDFQFFIPNSIDT